MNTAPVTLLVTKVTPRCNHEPPFKIERLAKNLIFEALEVWLQKILLCLI